MGALKTTYFNLKKMCQISKENRKDFLKYNKHILHDSLFISISSFAICFSKTAFFRFLKIVISNVICISSLLNAKNCYQISKEKNQKSCASTPLNIQKLGFFYKKSLIYSIHCHRINTLLCLLFQAHIVEVVNFKFRFKKLHLIVFFRIFAFDIQM